MIGTAVAVGMARGVGAPVGLAFVTERPEVGVAATERLDPGFAFWVWVARATTWAIAVANGVGEAESALACAMFEESRLATALAPAYVR